MSHYNLGLLYRTMRRFAEAEPLIKEAITVWENTLGEDHSYVVSGLDTYVNLLRATGRNELAAKVESRARAIREGKQQ